MDQRFNPFNELYVGETVSSSDFVELFSPSLLPITGALFLPGNVVLKGVQGSGKSMLLNLLKPEVRIAYEGKGKKFPLAGRYARFIGAGINLTTSNAIAFGQRRVQEWGDDSALPLFFGDFINCWIVYDLLQTIESLKDGLRRTGLRSINLKADPLKLDEFAQQLAAARCWFGYFSGVASYRTFKTQLENRINEYLAFLNFNADAVPERTRSTKTLIGEPIAQTAELIRRVGIIPEDVHVFIRIDQFEELFRLEGLHKQFGPVYRTVIYKALGLRNPYVSYRLGTRGSAWSGDLQMFGSTAQLERDRNYKLIDLDEMLRRQENARTWIFPKFADDVFDRRLRIARFVDETSSQVLLATMERGPSPDERARSYCRNTPQQVVRLDDDWPEPWKEFLKKLAESDPISARLGEAWARQKNRGKSSVIATIPSSPFPWNSTKYWRKERLQTALMQIAGRCFQRLTWAGRDDILELSGGNILVFVSICQHIWSAWLRTDPEVTPGVARISDAIQAVGIQETSTLWVDKIVEESGGSTRKRFVSLVATYMQKRLYDDAALSYPGHNGFSLDEEEYKADLPTFEFLRDCVTYGALFEFPHTTKSANRRPRRKWYLNPIYSPHFRLPHIHTKEPMYVTIAEVRRWIVAANQGRDEISVAPDSRSDQPSLFKQGGSQ